MKKFKTPFLIILFFAVQYFCSGQGHIEERIDSIILKYVQPNDPGVAIGIYKAGEVMFSKGYGLANLEHGIPFTPNTVFDIASNSKQFTALAILLLEQQGKLSLNDPIHNYIEEFPKYDTPIKIEHLIHNTSGLRDYGDLLELSNSGIDYRTSRSDFMQIMKIQKSLNFIPGELYSYSNTNWILLAIIIEKIEGIPFRQFMEKEIFGPLEMKNTVVRDNANMVVPNSASFYKSTKNELFELNYSWGRAYNLGGMAFINSTIEDLAKWDANFFTGKVGGLQLINRMHEKGVLNSGDSISYACGLKIGQYKGRKIVLHGGFGGGSSQITRFPDEELTFVIFSNRKYSELDTYGLSFELADLFVDDKQTTQRSSIHRDLTDNETTLDLFTSTYWHDKDLRFTSFTIENDQLAEVWLDERSPLQRIGATIFQDDYEYIEFSSDGSSAKGRHRPTGESYTLIRIDKWNPSQKVLERFIGNYESEELGIIWSISSNNQKLIVKRVGKPDFELEPVFDNSFKYKNWLVTFGNEDKTSTMWITTDRCKNILFMRN